MSGRRPGVVMLRTSKFLYLDCVYISLAASQAEVRPGRRGEPPDSDAAAEPANQIVEGNATLHTPGIELLDIHRIGQSPRCLVSKV
jgi:hypothetical protein